MTDRRRSLFRWNRILHRDVGYFCVALTLVYVVSGIAVNHIDDWNPNYVIAREERRFEPIPVTDRETMVRALVERLGLTEAPKGAFRPDPGTVELYYDGWSVVADAPAGIAKVERMRRRFALFEANELHLNRPKGLWTWLADGYAVLLGFLAVSGIFMLRGRSGLFGRGKWFLLAGLALPVIFLIALRVLGPGAASAGHGERSISGRSSAPGPPGNARPAP